MEQYPQTQVKLFSPDVKSLELLVVDVVGEVGEKVLQLLRELREVEG